MVNYVLAKKINNIDNNPLWMTVRCCKTMNKDTTPTLNIGMLSARDGEFTRVKVVKNGDHDMYRLGAPTGSRINRVLVYQQDQHGYIFFDHRQYKVDFTNRSNFSPKKRSGFYEIHPGDVAVVSMKDKKRRPTTNGAGQVYVIFDATTK